MEPIEIIGILSAILALAAFIGIEWGKLRAEYFSYDFLNLISALGLFYYAYDQGATPFMITNSVWAIVSGIDVARHVMKRIRKKHLIKRR
jgi:hypothetical protein